MVIFRIFGKPLWGRVGRSKIFGVGGWGWGLVPGVDTRSHPPLWSVENGRVKIFAVYAAKVLSAQNVFVMFSLAE